MASRQYPRGRTVRGQWKCDPVRREEDKVPRRGILPRNPSLQEFREVPADAGRISEDLTRIDADPERARCHNPARRRVNAMRYAAIRVFALSLHENRPA